MAFCNGAAVTSMFAFLPLYLRVVHGASPARVGLILLPITVAIGVGSVLTGRMVTRTGLTMVFPSYGLIAASGFLIFFALASAWMSVPQTIVTLSLAAVFMGTVMSVVQVTVQSAAGRRALGAAAGSVQFSRTVGAAVGVALLNTALFATLAISDPEALRTFSAVVDTGPQALDALDAVRRAAMEASIGAAFRTAFLMLAAFTATGILLAFTNPSQRI